jgi:hypothetical protein
VFVELDGTLRHVKRFYLSIYAAVSSSSGLGKQQRRKAPGTRVPLVQYTPKREKSTQMAPKPILVLPEREELIASGFQSKAGTLHLNNSHFACFERIQFKAATNNSRSRSSQEFYVLGVELYATCDDKGDVDKAIRVAFQSSVNLIVRGRSPRHYVHDGGETSLAGRKSVADDSNYSNSMGDGASNEESMDCSGTDVRTPTTPHDGAPVLDPAINQLNILTNPMSVGPADVDSAFLLPDLSADGIDLPSLMTFSQLEAIANPDPAATKDATLLPMPIPIPLPENPSVDAFNENALYLQGRLGINEPNPLEALVVRGNVQVTGRVFQPSDRRLKTDFQDVDTAAALETIENLRIYDYKLTQTWKDAIGATKDMDRGIIAQEVQALIPDAVTETSITLESDDSNLKSILVVDKDRIFMENVAATQELSKITSNLDSRLRRVEEEVIKDDDCVFGFDQKRPPLPPNTPMKEKQGYKVIEFKSLKRFRWKGPWVIFAIVVVVAIVVIALSVVLANPNGS